MSDNITKLIQQETKAGGKIIEGILCVCIKLIKKQKVHKGSMIKLSKES